MGFSLETLREGPFLSVGQAHRKLIEAAMRKTGVGWVVRGEDCPDCLHAHVTRASAEHVFKTISKYARETPAFLARDPQPWERGKSSRDVFLGMMPLLLAEIATIKDDIVVLVDGYKYCEHPKKAKVKTYVKGPK